MHNLYKRVFRHMYESKQFQTQKEIDLLNYCKDKTSCETINMGSIERISVVDLSKIIQYFL